MLATMSRRTVTVRIPASVYHRAELEAEQLARAAGINVAPAEIVVAAARASVGLVRLGLSASPAQNLNGDGPPVGGGRAA